MEKCILCEKQIDVIGHDCEVLAEMVTIVDTVMDDDGIVWKLDVALERLRENWPGVRFARFSTAGGPCAYSIVAQVGRERRPIWATRDACGRMA